MATSVTKSDYQIQYPFSPRVIAIPYRWSRRDIAAADGRAGISKTLAPQGGTAPSAARFKPIFRWL
jgi:hypothetical protein